MQPIGARPYKSRKSRPCDFCRSRKSACHMENGPPCQLCKERQRPCTFVQVPGKRKRPGTDKTSSAPVSKTPVPRANDELGELPLDARMSAFSAPSDTFNAEGPSVYENQRVRTPNDAIFNSEHLLYDPFADFDIEYEAGEDFGFQPSPMSVSGSNRSANAIMQSNSTPESPISQSRQDRSQQSTQGSSVISQQSRSHQEPGKSSFTRQGSLDAATDLSYRLIGLTGELDLYVLSHRSYDLNDESRVRYAGLKYRRMSSSETMMDLGNTLTADSNGQNLDHPPPVFTLINNELMGNAEPRMEQGAIDNILQDLRALISNNFGHRLILLFAHFIQPSFPILSSHQIPTHPSGVSDMPPALLAAICAVATPFITYDDELSIHLPQTPSPTRLFRLAWTLVCQEFHTPRLSTIQTCLILLQRHATNRYVPNSPFKQSIMSTIVTLSHNLGLHLDSSTWRNLPEWERKLRKRIWWTVWMMEKWIALGEGVPTTLHDDDSDVGPLTPGDIEDSIPEHVMSDMSTSHFIHLVTLTGVLSDIMKTYFTVRTAATTSVNLQKSLEAARSLRARLKQWQDSLPVGLKYPSNGKTVQSQSMARAAAQTPFCNLNVNGSFHLAYIVTQLTLFRALLRPVIKLSRSWNARDYEDDMPSTVELPAEDLEASKAVIVGALAWIKEAVELAENLHGSEWDAFWHSWSRTNFAIVASIILNLLMLLRPSTSLESSARASNSTNQTQPAQPHASNVPTRSPNLDQFLLRGQTQAQSGSNPTLQQPAPDDHRPNPTCFLHMQDSYTELLDYMTRWRWTMKISSRGAGGRKGLMNLSLLRIDAMVAELGG